MRNIQQKLCLASIVFFGILFSANSLADTIPQAGKDYQVLEVQANSESSSETLSKSDDKKVHVIEFFSYGCPACFLLDDRIEKWRKQDAALIKFERIPVVFHPQWQILAKAFYALESINSEKKVHESLFKAIHEKHIKLSTEDELKQWLGKNGVSQEDFANAFEFSPVIEAKMVRGQNTAIAYDITVVPSIVINGKYKTDPSMVDSDPERFMEVIAYLAKKESLSNP